MCVCVCVCVCVLCVCAAPTPWTPCWTLTSTSPPPPPPPPRRCPCLSFPSAPPLTPSLVRTCTYVCTVRVKKKPVRTCAKSTVAAVHINSRVNIAYAHARQSSGSCTALCAQRTKSSQSLVRGYSNSRGMGLLERWVVVRVACLPLPVQP